ncbi:ABC transporter substrate binding protein [Arcobacter sp. LA11]|uniref:ABC transporter substrate binding protein n=1 Tax=Arcobacter sp. LA11 TaxID=1898176 RepID=UPI00093476D9|nr:ABC transporter substrate binding protein [Arcobacter sp. LA11]
MYRNFKQFCIFIILVLFTTNTLAKDKPKILILHSYHQSYKWTSDINNGIHSIFNDLTKIDLYVEYMDTKKYIDESYYNILTEIYKKKYSNIKFDLIISSDDNAFNFLKKHNFTLFKNSPVVFCGTNYLKEESLKGFPNFTGVNEKADLEENYNLILKLHPNTKKIYTITDTTKTGQLIKNEVKTVTKKYKDKKIEFPIIDDVTFPELIKKVQKFQKDSVILFTFFFRTKDNKFLEYYKAIEGVDKNSNIPIYGLWDFTLNHGIIGGYLTSGYFQGQAAGKIASKILDGRDVKSIPILEKSPNEYIFDYKQIKKYKVDESNIPFGSIFINKKDSLMDLYFKEIVALTIIFILMILFIITLLINITKRKLAEKRINKQLVFQQNLIDNVNTPIYYKNINREYIGCNKAFLELMQVEKNDILNKTAYNLIDNDSAKIFYEKDSELLRSREVQEYDGNLTLKDGTRKDLIYYKNVFFEDGEIAGIVGAIFDITERNSLNYELNRLLSSFDKNVIASKTDINGKLIYVSEAFIKVSGYREKELLGKTHNVLKSGINNDSLYEDLWQTICEKKIWLGEIVNKKKNGEIYTLHTIITPEYDKNGEFLNYTAISQDITAQKLIQKANQEIELLNEDITSTQKEIIFRLGAIAEARSKETGMHVKRVAEYSKLLALYYGLSKNESEIVKMASPMHDIGKIAIPDAILNKPGPFTKDEFEVMKTHSKIGYDMLKDSNKKILKAAAIIAYEHQEKYDGSGYPRGLKGEEIHIYGRITAIADVFDALGSSRVYKKAWKDKEIFEFFREEAGKHFDPILINLFFKNLNEFLKIRDNFKDI